VKIEFREGFVAPEVDAEEAAMVLEEYGPYIVIALNPIETFGSLTDEELQARIVARVTE
jgi:hypothetical protein